MARGFRVKFRKGMVAAGLGLQVAAATWLLFAGKTQGPEVTAAAESFFRKPTVAPQLVAVVPLPAIEGEMCQWVPAGASRGLMAALQQERSAAAPAEAARPEDADRAPIRVIRDTYPTYSAVAVNLRTDEVFLQDENLFGIKVFNRLDNTPPTARFTEPKRAIAGGETTKLEFNCGLYVDPTNGDIYSITNDTVDTMTVFPWNASGEFKPLRELSTPHGTYGISVDEQAQEIYMTVQHENSVVVYPKTAQGEDKPSRVLQGDKTQLEDPHGVAVDFKNKLLFVSNHGNANLRASDSGSFEPASITVYPLKASGDTAPIRILEGPKTRLNWPAALWVENFTWPTTEMIQSWRLRPPTIEMWRRLE